MIAVVGVFRKSMMGFLICVISLDVLIACAGKGHSRFDELRDHKSVLSPNGPRVAVVRFEDWNPPDEGYGRSLMFVPGILFVGHNIYLAYESSGVELALALQKAGAFSAADFHDEWPSAQTLQSGYDFVVTGRQLGNGYNSRAYHYGLSTFAFFPWLLGLPMNGTMHFGDVEVVVFHVATPYEPIHKERVSYETSRAWDSVYYHNEPDSSEKSAKWHEASQHIASAIRASGKAAQ